MNATVELGESFLLARFREFYHEVIRLKQQIRSQSLVAAPVAASPVPPAEPEGPEATEPASEVEAPAAGEEDATEHLANQVWQRLLYLLEQQEIMANRLGGEYVRELYKDAQFVMAALADEIFLHLPWEGRPIWQSNLLETKLFQTHAAGEIFFQKVDALLKHRDPVQAELAKVYLMALAFGFQGRYRGDEQGQARLDFYRRELFHFIFHRNPDILNEARHICPEAYQHTIGEGVGLKLEHPQKWFLYLLLVLVLLLFASSRLWDYLTEDLYVIINQIVSEA